MAYQAFKQRRKRPIYKRRYNRNGWRNMRLGTLARKAYSGMRMLKGIVNAEKKTFDTSANGVQGSSPTITCLNLLAQGDDYNSREGRSILAKTFQLQFRAIISSAATTPTFVRYVIFKDLGMDGSNAPSSGELVSSIYAMRNSDPVYMKRYVVLCDQTIGNLSADSRENTYQEKFIRLNHHIKFAGTGTANTDQGEGSLWLLQVSNQATDTPTLIWTARLRFYDN